MALCFVLSPLGAGCCVDVRVAFLQFPGQMALLSVSMTGLCGTHSLRNFVRVLGGGGGGNDGVNKKH